MPGVTIVVHDYRPEDLGQVLQLWQQTGGFDAEGLAVDQSVELLSTAGAFAVVAEADNQLVGAVLAAAAANIGWIYRLSLLPGQPEEQEIAERLLAALETRAAEAGGHKPSAVVP